MKVSAKGPPMRVLQRVDYEPDKIQGSRFIATLAPMSESAEVIELQAQLRAQHPHSRHVCYAYVGASEHETRWSDDGEPSKTAGVPLLRVLLGTSLRDAGLLVVRYFGGVKLGTGGLVRAYTRAARAAVEHAALRPLEQTVACRLRCAFPVERDVRHEVMGVASEVSAVYQAAGVELCFACRRAEVSSLVQRLEARSGAAFEWLEPRLDEPH